MLLTLCMVLALLPAVTLPAKAGTTTYTVKVIAGVEDSGESTIKIYKQAANTTVDLDATAGPGGVFGERPNEFPDYQKFNGWEIVSAQTEDTEAWGNIVNPTNKEATFTVGESDVVIRAKWNPAEHHTLTVINEDLASIIEKGSFSGGFFGAGKMAYQLFATPNDGAYTDLFINWSILDDGSAVLDPLDVFNDPGFLRPT